MRETKYRLNYFAGDYVEHRELAEIYAYKAQPDGDGVIDVIEMTHTVTNDPNHIEYETSDAADHAARILSEDTFRRVTTEQVVGQIS